MPGFLDNFFSNENLCRRKGVQVARIILLFFFAIIPQVEPQAKTPGGYFWEGFYKPHRMWELFAWPSELMRLMVLRLFCGLVTTLVLLRHHRLCRLRRHRGLQMVRPHGQELHDRVLEGRPPALPREWGSGVGGGQPPDAAPPVGSIRRVDPDRTPPACPVLAIGRRHASGVWTHDDRT